MITDISRPIHAHMAIYPQNPAVNIATIREASSGKTALSEITLGSHTGTHIDAPSHIHSGGKGVDVYSLEQLIGDAQVVEIDSSVETINGKDIPPTSCERVLLKTKNSQNDINTFVDSFVALSEDGAQELLRRNIRLIGVDGFSIKKRGVADRVHELFLDAGVVIVEGLYLQQVAPGSYRLICLPLPVVGVDGAPVRAVLDSR